MLIKVNHPLLLPKGEERMTRSLQVQQKVQKEKAENEKYLQGQKCDQRKQHNEAERFFPSNHHQKSIKNINVTHEV